MQLEINSDTTLGYCLIRLAEEAVVLHSRMTGDADVPERFIRDQIAAGLYRALGTFISIEARLGQSVRKEVIEKVKIAQFDTQLLDTQLPDGRLSPGAAIDLVLWHPTYPKIMHPLAIAEVKRGQDAAKDIERTSWLLAFCHPATWGFQVVAEVCKKERIEEARNKVARIVSDHGVICMPALERQPVCVNERDDWCIASAISVVRRGDPC